MFKWNDQAAVGIGWCLKYILIYSHGIILITDSVDKLLGVKYFELSAFFKRRLCN